MKNNSTYTAAFYTLGCRVNQYETRAVEEAFQKLGFEIGSFGEKCDVYVINTCTVTAESDRKSRQMIRRAVKNGKNEALIIVMGCMSQISPEQAVKIEGVSAVFGNSEKLAAAEYARKALDGKKNNENAHNFVTDIFLETEIEKMSVCGSDNTRAFLKVVDGCENNCSYCIIPKARGKIRSKTEKDVVEECKDIVSKGGCREIVLTGIETAAYGKDTNSDLAELSKAVSEIENVKRIRLGSLEPTVIKEELCKKFSEIPSFMPHFHLSLQSGCDSILALMKRKYNTKMFYEKLLLIRKYFPDALFTTDIIVGFPGETREMFEETVRFVEKCGFLYVHVFPYSDRKGTKASEMDGKLSESEKHERAVELTAKMFEVRRSVLEKYLGKKAKVLCETSKDGFVHGYTENYIEVRFADDGKVKPNDIVEVELCSISEDTGFMLAVLQA